MKRFLDWIGTGSILSPENIAVSLLYDTVDEDFDNNSDSFGEDFDYEFNWLSEIETYEELEQLYDMGFLTQDEFESMKKHFLG